MVIQTMQMGFKPPWESFPPADIKQRLTLYELYRRVLLGGHREIFDQSRTWKPNSELSSVVNAVYLAKEKSTKPYVVLNYCKTVATTFASKMFGNAPKYTVGYSDELAQQRIEKIVTDNTLNNTNIEQAMSSVALGGSVYRVRYGKMLNWQEDMPIIEPVPAKNYMAITAPDNIKDIRGAVLFFEFQKDNANYVKLEIHEPYTVTHEVWALDSGKMARIIPTEAFAMFDGLMQTVEQNANISYQDGRVIEDTGYPGLLVEYVPNFLLPDEYYGHSDYENLLSIQEDINQTATGILQVILKHIDPKLILPPGTMTYDEKRGQWVVIKEDMEVVEVPVEVGAVLPRYLTWDASLGAAKANVDALFEAFMILADISLPMLGMTKYGTAESASAIELKMTQTTDAVNRKRMYYDTALKNVLYAAQWLDVHYGGQSYEPQEVNITWPSPVPIDQVTMTSMHAQRLDAGLESSRTAVAAVQQLEGDALEAELDEIDVEKAASAAAFSARLRPVTGPETPIDDEDPPSDDE